MGKKERIDLIREIEQERGSKVFTYITSTRQNLEASIAMDVIRIFYEHLRQLPKGDNTKIDLFLVSNGGDGTAPWRLVTLIREYCKIFSVLIPYRAFSAATLMSLGADKIIMHPMGMLGPTDPTVSNPFNPINEHTQQQIGISVEDVTAYISLIKEDAGITHEDELVQAFNKLVDKVHPLALGNVKRSLSQSKMMAKKLLSLHMNNAEEAHKIDEIIDNLTSKLYYHGHPINRKEAKEQIGIKTIEEPSARVEQLMWDLFVEYDKEIKSEIPFDPGMEFINAANLKLNTSEIIRIKSNLAYIESVFRTDVFEMEHDVFGIRDGQGRYNINTTIVKSGWKSE